MKFGKVLEALEDGVVVRRESWGFSKWIARQIPQSIPEEVIPKMTSISPCTKRLCETGIRFHDQVLLIEDHRRPVLEATSYVPSWEDIFADDWVIG